MIDVLAGVGVIALVIGAGIFVNYMSDRDDNHIKEEMDKLDDDWWSDI